MYVTASWPDKDAANKSVRTNEAVIWDTIITSPSADHLQNIGPAAMRKLVASAKGKAIDPNRYVGSFLSFSHVWDMYGVERWGG